MPELPDVELYITRLRERTVGSRLDAISIFSPFVLRSVSPKPSEIVNRTVLQVSRMGKRIVFELSDAAFVVIHLMIAGRFQWQSPAPPLTRPVGKVQLASLRFEQGVLTLIESGSKKRASIHLVAGTEGLEAFRRDGLDVLTASESAFAGRLTAANRTLKRALTDPATFDGIGNAYSDEILFHARLSPMRLTQSLQPPEVAQLHQAAVDCLTHWRERLQELVPGFPKPNQVTAFRPDFAVHGRFGKPCSICGMPVQRIVYAENEANYCAECQNEGRLLADRSLSRLLKADWPKTLEEMLGGD
jgi:formamidopyrimidine-DNA glycosylase